MVQVRVMTYNIFMGGRRGPALHAVVRDSAPDVLVVNEAPKRLFESRLRCRRLSGEWRLRYVAGGRDAGSNMLAVSDLVAVGYSATEVLPQPPFQPRRGIVSAQLAADGRPFGVVGCHLSLDRGRRLGEVERVLDVADAFEGPVVVAGDLNERPTGPSWRRLLDSGFHDHGSADWKTFPSDRPDRRIDALLVRGAAKVLRHGGPDVDELRLERASDHRPVLAVLGL
jgi:endonuclease/exonuclease/phosphatase family metal-dependent hydrolase